MANFRRFDSDDLKIMDSQDFPNRFGVAQHIRELYEIIAEAEQMAENVQHQSHCDSLFWDPDKRAPCMDEDVCVCDRRQAREFLERLSK